MFEVQCFMCILAFLFIYLFILTSATEVIEGKYIETFNISEIL